MASLLRSLRPLNHYAILRATVGQPRFASSLSARVKSPRSDTHPLNVQTRRASGVATSEPIEAHSVDNKIENVGEPLSVKQSRYSECYPDWFKEAHDRISVFENRILTARKKGDENTKRLLELCNIMKPIFAKLADVVFYGTNGFIRVDNLDDKYTLRFGDLNSQAETFSGRTSPQAVQNIAETSRLHWLRRMAVRSKDKNWLQMMSRSNDTPLLTVHQSTVTHKTDSPDPTKSTVQYYARHKIADPPSQDKPSVRLICSVMRLSTNQEVARIEETCQFMDPKSGYTEPISAADFEPLYQGLKRQWDVQVQTSGETAVAVQRLIFRAFDQIETFTAAIEANSDAKHETKDEPTSMTSDELQKTVDKQKTADLQPMLNNLDDRFNIDFQRGILREISRWKWKGAHSEARKSGDGLITPFTGLLVNSEE
ncbi:hypothetical protein FLONG3_1570 [Fusarium longipes]|uniref:Uncharacterized protein n=1 Tax=Fusarium longipes TaxID=694270 RepID=A0A395T772_9HYPO|nr:hypothetical protein FLONG3_1570 [Fusarium longipes]